MEIDKIKNQQIMPLAQINTRSNESVEKIENDKDKDDSKKNAADMQKKTGLGNYIDTEA